jgi:hypothetical protein
VNPDSLKRTSRAEPRPGDEYWWTGFGPPGAGRPVRGGTRYEGDLVVVGAFDVIGATVANGVAGWDGSSWYAFEEGVTREDREFPYVHAVAVYGDKLAIGGLFTQSGTTPLGNFALWDAAAQRWESGGVECNGEIFALHVWNEKLVFGGAFTQVNGLPVRTIAMIDSEGNLETVGGVGANHKVRALTTFAGDLVAGGFFTDVSGVPAARVARWSGSTWSAMGEGFNRPVSTLYVYQGQLLAGGEFTSSGTTPVPNVARWDGVAWVPMGSQALGEGPTDVSAFYQHEGRLIAGGSCGDLHYDGLSVWDGTEWSPLAPEGVRAGHDCGVDLLITDGTDLVVGGGFGYAGGRFGHSIVRWDGAKFHPICPGYGLSWTSVGLGLYADKLVVGGHLFEDAGCIHAPHLALWTGEGWESPGVPDATVRCGGEYESDLIVGGTFSSVDGTPAKRIARWDGASWYELGGGVEGIGSAVNAVQTYRGELVVGGIFSSAGGVPASTVAIWNGDSWRELRGTDGRALMGGGVAAIAHYGEYLVLCGGLHFGPPDTSPMVGVVLWDGQDFIEPGGGIREVGGTCYAATEYRGDLVVGGSFESVQGVPAFGIARWDGVAWHDLAVGTDNDVRGLALHGEDLIAGGFFVVAGDQYSPGAAKWDGTAWHAMGSGLDRFVPDVLEAISFQGSVYFAGEITDAGVYSTAYLARWIEPINTPIEAVELTGSRRDGAALLRWRDVGAGSRWFHVLRAKPGQARVLITTAPIGGTSSGEFVDAAAPETRLAYWLSEVGSSGVYGPAYVPALVRSPSRPLGLRVVPNPSSGGARISFLVLDDSTAARVLVFGAGGREIRSWVLESLESGETTIQWDGRDERGIAASPGTYFVKVAVGDHLETRKLVLAP